MTGKVYFWKQNNFFWWLSILLLFVWTLPNTHVSILRAWPWIGSTSFLRFFNSVCPFTRITVLARDSKDVHGVFPTHSLLTETNLVNRTLIAIETLLPGVASAFEQIFSARFPHFDLHFKFNPLHKKNAYPTPPFVKKCPEVQLPRSWSFKFQFCVSSWNKSGSLEWIIMA